MDKKYYLSSSEQTVYELIRHNTNEAVSNSSIKGLFPQFSSAKLNKICSSLIRKGYLFKLSRGRYIIQDGHGKDVQLSNPYKIALSLYKGYIGFSSALKLYGLIEYEPFTIYVVTKIKSRTFKLGQYTFKAVSMGKRATGETYFNGLYLSTLEKTFFDCFYRPQYASYSDLAKALYLNKGCNWEQLIEYFQRFASDSLCQRSGYILSILKKETNAKIPKGAIGYLAGRIKHKSRLIPKNNSTGEYCSEWKIIDNLGRDNILSWWRNG